MQSIRKIACATFEEDSCKPVPVVEPHSLPRPVLAPPELHQYFSNEMAWHVGERLPFQLTFARVAGFQNAFEKITRADGECSLNFSGLLAKAAEGIDQLRVVFPFQLWNELTSNAIAGERLVGVGPILAKILPQFAQIIAQRSTAKSEKRPDQPQFCVEVANGRHATQSCETRPAQYVMQDRFRLIVGRMGHRHPPAIKLPRRLSEESVTGVACRLFNSASRIARGTTDICNSDRDGDRKGPAKRFDPGGIGIGLGAAQVMVQMGCHHFQSMFRLHINKRPEQSNAVGPARNTDENSAPFDMKRPKRVFQRRTERGHRRSGSQLVESENKPCGGSKSSGPRPNPSLNL